MNIAQTGSQFAFDDYLRANGNVAIVDVGILVAPMRPSWDAMIPIVTTITMTSRSAILRFEDPPFFGMLCLPIKRLTAAPIESRALHPCDEEQEKVVDRRK